MQRDPRIDVFRGLALLIIFIDHVPGNLWSFYTLGNYGLSDAAEGFVLLSGISAGLAYGPFFQAPVQLWTGFGRIGRRVWTLYLVHILVTMLALAVAAALATQWNNPGLLAMNQIDVVLAEPLQFFLRLPVLGFLLDYGDILPLYVVLLVCAPFGLWLATRAPLVLFGGSVLVWALAGLYRINLPNYPHEAGWFFNPLSWQLIFVMGLLTGVAIRNGRRLVPVRVSLQILATSILVFSLVWKQHAAFGAWLYWHFAQAGEAGLPAILVSFDKTYLPLPRIVHAAALGYLLSSFAGVRWACTTVIAAPFALLGREALAVFATGSVLVYLMQGIRAGTAPDAWQDTRMLAAGMIVLFGLAAARQCWPKR